MKEINAKIRALWVLLWANRYFLITDEGKSISCSQVNCTDNLINKFVDVMKKSKELPLQGEPK